MATVKNKSGKRLIQIFCVPRRPSKANPKLFWEPEDKPEDWADFGTYCKDDVETLRHAWRVLPDWNYPGNDIELAVWALDQRINDRGLPIDMVGVSNAIQAAADVVQKLNEETVELTNGKLKTMKQAAAATDYIQSLGVPLPNMTKETVSRFLEKDNLPAEARRLLEIRQQVSKSSTAKYTKIKDAAVEGRVQECFVYSGAGRTKRWAGRLVQFQNMPRGIFYNADDIYLAVDAINAGIVDFCYDDPMAVISSSIRPMIKAEPGNKLVVSDLSNIEGRGIAWLAGEEWKLQAFRDFDQGTGPDLYILSYSKAFKVPIDQVGKPERQIGKVMELAMGYEGGVGAFVTFANTYHIDLNELPEKVLPNAPQWAIDQATRMYHWFIQQGKPTFDLSEKTFVTCDVLKRLWRAAHPRIVQLWADCKDAAINAVLTPGQTFVAGKLAFKAVEHNGLPFLLMKLPSGDYLSYFNPSVKDGSLRYYGMSQSASGARKWMKLNTYGGKLVENANQAISRNIMATNMLGIDMQFPLIGSVHDETISEVDEQHTERDAEALSRMLAFNPAWCPDLPLAAAGYQHTRYRKD